MIMPISLIGTLAQIRMVTAYITFPGMGPRRGQCAFLMSVTIQICMHFRQLVIMFGFSASYFLEMIMLKIGRHRDSKTIKDW